ncbi:GlxA family transcriptional regulator [Bordetella holmesii]|uniref:DNA-binding helix-turn-helix protein n=2 Tax=Bordetella holmesii TaxID=35814 RepID=A0A158M8P5_9BORD|nr:helix-turn-helix domain-containing protein [Bordetella holmesii]AHV91445.1 bacterial regulatory helix-turn-helix s, AraC family protein [Bordetella holmesii ATCC 51541]AIT26695.1 bacterial regulatory helix-turn-helix s, AraC family protein [Bordetella holmesii 44057]EWM42425.1 bacterial regulatory helix-turn-helix s, AraC family protein [Bordetella holmesii 41130]EWM47281.1 bacterial regulatory helix-turn-helix s, AraC family protein [Bordetella holmesii 35009]EWM51438.1 bacterial regulator
MTSTPVYFVVQEDIVLLDLAGPAEALRIANHYVPGRYALHYCGPQQEVQSGLQGLYLSRLAPLPQSLPSHALVVISGQVNARHALERPDRQALIAWLARRAAADGFGLMSVCAGALMLAAAGLLGGRECTSHHSCLEALRALAPDARVLENRIFVESAGLWTSAGITAGIDLALYLVARDCGARVASAVAREMVVYMRRAGSDAALSPWLDHRNHLHPGVHRVQDAVLREPAAQWSAQGLAELAHTSARHLNRLFAEHAGCTPMDYVYQVRLTLAKELLRETRLDLERVAERTGFSSAHHLRRVWRRHEAGPPSAVRAGP